MKLTSEVKSTLSRLLADATDEENTGKRADLLKRYFAEPYGDEIEGRSRFVDASASDAVEALMPEIMDVFTSADNIVEFEPIGPEDEEAAKQETAVVSHVFWQKNNGFEILSTWIKECLIQQNAYCWRGWVEKETVTVEEYEALSFEEYQGVMLEIQQEGGEYEIKELTGLTLMDDGMGGEIALPEFGEDGQPAEINVSIRCVKVDKSYVIEPFPQEDFFITPRWGKITLDGVPCCGRRHRDKTREDWLAFGFSEESIESLTKGIGDGEEASSARHHTNDTDASESSTEYLELYETYVRLDVDGDDIAELVQIWCSEDGTQIMEWADGGEAIKEVASIPISALTPIIIPHRHIGRSVVENVDDIQRVKTVLMRQMLDNIYSTNYARPQFDENNAGEHTYGDLMNPAPGAPIRTGGVMVEWTAPQPVFTAVIPLLEKFDNLQEIRTGATRYNQGLDAESLNKTASGISQIMNASQKKAKLIARTIAETGLRDLFLGIHADLRRGPLKRLVTRLRGQWVQVNPRTWKHRTDMTVNVGMGRGDRDERRAGLMLVAQTQEKLAMSGSRMVDEQRLFSTAADTLATFGMHHAEKYFNDPQRMPPPPPPEAPPPDPLMMDVQARAQKFQADTQRDMMRLQLDAQERQRQHELEMQKLRLQELELTNKIQDQSERLMLDKRKAVMVDDLERDKLAVQGTPAVSYGQVTGDTR